MTNSNIVPLTEENLAAADSLARAFHNDPLQSYVFPDENERRMRSPAHFAPLLRYGMLFGEVLTTEGNPLGAAVWLPPETWEVTPELQQRRDLILCQMFWVKKQRIVSFRF
jgi:hypothetical protein